MTPFETLIYFIKERENIRIQKEAGIPPPWTQDNILSSYRFCNVRREDDKVTRWIARTWRSPHADDPDLWFAMAVARHVNLPETLKAIGYPVPWNAKKFLKAIRTRKEQDLAAYNAAYMIRAASGKEWEDKAEYLAKAVLGKLWNNRKKLRPVEGDTLQAFHERLQAEYGLGSFLAGQILADTKFVLPLRNAPDWWDFAVSGPGSRRGLNRILGRDPKSPWKEKEWREELVKLRAQMRPRFQLEGIEWITASDAQNCLCEIGKYFKALTGEGRPKQRYVASLLRG